MKRKLSMLLALALLLSLCTVCVHAADAPVDGFYNIVAGSTGLTITAKKDGAAVGAGSVDVDGDGNDDTVYPGSNQLDVSFKGTAGYQYLVLLYTGSSTVPTVDNEICYINQTADESGNVNFLVYPNLDGVKGAMTLMITSDAPGFTTKTVTLYYAPSYTLGDVNEDTEVDAKDALKVLRAAANLEILSDRQKLAANVNGDSDVDAKDALKILRYAADLINDWTE